MQKIYYIIILYISCCSILIANEAKLAEDDYKWFNITGLWSILNNNTKFLLTENRIRVNNWNYSELVNNNTIVTFNSLGRYSKILFNLELQEQKKKSTAFMMIFAMKDQNQFYAIKFNGDEKKINTVSLISSKYKDFAKGGQLKGNFIISEFESRALDLEYGKKNKILMQFSGNKISFSVNNKLVLEISLTENIDKGKIGFASNQVKPFIDTITVYDRKKIVFEDDFSKDLIKRISVTGRIENKK